MWPAGRSPAIWCPITRRLRVFRRVTEGIRAHPGHGHERWVLARVEPAVRHVDIVSPRASSRCSSSPQPRASCAPRRSGHHTPATACVPCRKARAPLSTARLRSPGPHPDPSRRQTRTAAQHRTPRSTTATCGAGLASTARAAGYRFARRAAASGDPRSRPWAAVNSPRPRFPVVVSLCGCHLLGEWLFAALVSDAA
jgi:hypothetical protein